MLLESPLVRCHLSVSTDFVVKPWKCLAAAPGRSLRFAPEWQCSDAKVVFDRNSGDYWVVSQLADLALKQLQNSTSITVSDLLNALAPRILYADVAAAMDQTLQSLIDNGLVRATP